MNNKMIQILKDGQIIIPLTLFKLKDKLKLEYDEFIFLMYLYNKGELFPFDPSLMTKELGYDLANVMKYIASLTDKHMLSVEVRRNDKNVMEEYVNLQDFYTRLSLLLMEEVNDEKIDPVTIFQKIEQEFGRTLSPMEYEIIKAWLENNYSEEIINEALKEAVYNGVSNLRYMDKILYEWNKKGLKTKNDVEKQHLKYREDKKESVEVFDYNWLEDDDDE